MTISTTSIFNVSAQTLIDLCLADIGANGPDGSTNPALRPLALTHLNLVMKRIDTKGLFTWRSPRRVVSMVAGQASYTLANDTYDIDQPARYTQAGATYGSQVMSMVRDEYMGLPDRTISGIPYRYFVDRSLDASGIISLTAYLYPVPPTTGDTLEIASALKSKDVTDLSQTLDISQKWLDAIRWNLTESLCPAYSVPVERWGMISGTAKSRLDDALGDDNERGGIQLVPFGDSSYGYGAWGGRG